MVVWEKHVLLIYCKQGYAKPFKIIGIPDEYTVTGSQQDIFNHYGINEKGISNVVMSLLK